MSDEVQTSDSPGAASGRIPPGQKVATSVVELYLGDDGIVHQRSIPFEQYTIEDAREHIALLGRVTGERKHPVLADIRGIEQGSDREVREYYASVEGTRYFAALAILVDSAFTRLLGNFFFQVQRPPCPSRLFTDEQAALAWLSQFVPEGWSS